MPPACIMLVGLQGSGKTTTAAKLAKYLETKNKKKTLLVSLDVYRPAAQEQLSILGEKNSIQTLPIVKDQLPADIVKRALNSASLSGVDSIIFDTAGRTQIDLSMMNEIKEIKTISNPIETILVADSLTGQVAVSVAQEFKKAVDLTGIILTRVDGDGRGGAALSMKFSTNIPIKFMGVGEKISQLEQDYKYIYHLAAVIGVQHVLKAPYEVLTKNFILLNGRAQIIHCHNNNLTRLKQKT